MAMLMPVVADKANERECAVRQVLRGPVLRDEPQINGRMVYSDGYGTVVIYDPFVCFIYAIVMLFVPWLKVGALDARIELPLQMPEHTVVQVAQELMRGFWEGQYCSLKTVNLKDLTADQLILATQFTEHVNLFLLAHELGHGMMKFYPKSVESEVYIGSISAEPLKTVFLRRYGSVLANEEKLRKDWSSELAADLIGLRLCLKAAEDAYDRCLAHSAVQILFAVHRLLLRYRERVRGDLYAKIYQNPSAPTYHPPSQLRLDFLSLYPADMKQKETVEFDAKGLNCTLLKWTDYVLEKIDHL